MPDVHEQFSTIHMDGIWMINCRRSRGALDSPVYLCNKPIS
ncbi:hypothetical protein EKH55_3957 [Sinorhizobium alkalisoli]|nr:hypothetical protein EKH55_3957 [Sinorhizobium alkalisoli]